MCGICVPQQYIAMINLTIKTIANISTGGNVTWHFPTRAELLKPTRINLSYVGICFTSNSERTIHILTYVFNSVFSNISCYIYAVMLIVTKNETTKLVSPTDGIEI